MKISDLPILPGALQNTDQLIVETSAGTHRIATSAFTAMVAGLTSLPDVNINPGSYGDGTHVATYTVDTRGLITNPGLVPIAISPGAAGLGNVVNALQVINAGNVPSFMQDIFVNRPAPGTPNRLFIDQTNNRIQRDTGTDWTDVSNATAGINNIIGDATAAGEGTVTITLSTVSTTTGYYGNVDKVPCFNVNGKGLVTWVEEQNIAITPAAAGLGNVVNALQVVNGGSVPALILDTLPNRPAAGTYGRLFVDTTNNRIQRDTGVDWNDVSTGIAGITSLTGDGTASGSGSVPLTLVNVNPHPGTHGDGANIPVVTTNAKGLITDISTVPVTFGLGNVVNALQVINAGGTPSIVQDTFANRPAAAVDGRIFIDITNHRIQRDTGTTWEDLSSAGVGITTITGDATATGSGSVALTFATVNPHPGTYGDGAHIPVITTNAKGLITDITTIPATGGAGQSRYASFAGAFTGPITTGPRWYPRTACTITNVVAYCSATPTEAVQVDVQKNGVSIFSSTYPTVAITEVKGLDVAVSVAMTPTDYLTVVLNSGAGYDLVVRVDYQ